VPDNADVTVATRDPVVEWLLQSEEPAIRHGALTQLLGRPASDPEVVAARTAIPAGPLVSALLAGQEDDGGFGFHPYRKWGGAHWRLVSLADLGVPPETPGLREALSTVLDWLAGEGHVGGVKVIDGLARRCGSQEGNALFVAAHLGAADDPRVRQIAGSMVAWQWPDGGWNCDARRGVTHSSFNESLPPLLGLAAYAQATDDDDARAAADRAAAFLLKHRVIYSERTGKLAHPSFTHLRYPPYWHYDALAALKALERSGHIGDPRTSDALDLLESKRRPDGMWHADGYHWNAPAPKGSNLEVVDWGRGGPSEPLTLGALRVLRAAGRWSP
jgi:hypothetical protein